MKVLGDPDVGFAFNLVSLRVPNVSLTLALSFAKHLWASVT